MPITIRKVIRIKIGDRNTIGNHITNNKKVEEAKKEASRVEIKVRTTKQRYSKP